MMTRPPLTPLASGRGIDGTASPLPLAGGVGGGPVDPTQRGQFKQRNTLRAKELRNQASPAERLLWTALSNRKVAGHKFSRQMPIGPYFADFLCRAARLVVELDGFSHDTRQDYDRRRDHFMQQQGYVVLRFTNDDVMQNLDGVTRAIAIALGDAGPPPTPPASGRGAEGAEKLLGSSLEGSEG
jgi:very-short-patch-repair endonuclease